MRNEEPDAIERVMDAALARCVSAEPLAGLEQRVLQRMRFDRARRRLAWWAWALATAGLAVVAVVWMRTTPESLTVPMFAPQAPEIAAARVAPRPPRRLAVPRRREFPTPRPLTPEERALAALVTQSPDVARALERRSDGPIVIEEIQIEPLE